MSVPCTLGIVSVEKNQKGVTRTPLEDLFTNFELLDQRAIFVHVLLSKVVQQAAALTDHLQEATAAVVVLRVLLEVRRERVDVRCQDRDLDFGAAAIVGGLSVLRSSL